MHTIRYTQLHTAQMASQSATRPSLTEQLAVERVLHHQEEPVGAVDHLRDNQHTSRRNNRSTDLVQPHDERVAQLLHDVHLAIRLLQRLLRHLRLVQDLYGHLR